MPSDFLLYGTTGFVGSAIAQMAMRRGLKPLIAGRDPARIQAQAAALGVEGRVFSLDDAAAMDQALQEVPLVLHCAGPYIHTSRQMAGACLRTGRHYLDISGEIPVYEALAARDDEAKARGVMLLPGVGFDVVPTDCLAVYLKQRLPSATRLTLAFHNDGPANLPPGTANTAMEQMQNGNLVRRNGRLEPAGRGSKTRPIDFGRGPVQAMLLSWGDIFTAWYSTGIPNIEVYAALPLETQRQLALIAYIRPLFNLRIMRQFARGQLKTGSTPEERSRTRASVWGQAEDEQGRKATARLHGPEAGVEWTGRVALAAVQQILAGHVFPGYQTSGRAFGPDFVLECEGVTREDLE